MKLLYKLIKRAERIKMNIDAECLSNRNSLNLYKIFARVLQPDKVVATELLFRNADRVLMDEMDELIKLPTEVNVTKIIGEDKKHLLSMDSIEYLLAS